MILKYGHIKPADGILRQKGRTRLGTVPHTLRVDPEYTFGLRPVRSGADPGDLKAILYLIKKSGKCIPIFIFDNTVITIYLKRILGEEDREKEVVLLRAGIVRVCGPSG